MSPPDIIALHQYLGPELKDRTISDARHSVSLTDITQHSCLTGRSCELSGRSVLLATSGQLLSALAMIELDGVARRMLSARPTSIGIACRSCSNRPISTPSSPIGRYTDVALASTSSLASTCLNGKPWDGRSITRPNG
jgi:hypothetical protein